MPTEDFRSALARSGSLIALALMLLILQACGGESGPGRLDVVALQEDLRPARPGSTYASELIDCARVFNRGGNNNHAFCTLERLPLLGQERETLTPEAVLERTLVSHDWMAQRFEQALRAQPDELLQLFKGVTAVVIGTDIRPSYYWLSTGAIYLDPARLWLDIAERDTISEAPDYRSGFDRELDFDVLWRYVRDGDYAWRNEPLSGPGQSRELEQILAPLAALLFHELAHANDYLPPSERSNLDVSLTPAQAASRVQSASVSAALARDYPLSSELMMDLAEVMYQGRDATEQEQQLAAQDVGLNFSQDTASDSYSYVTASRTLFLEDTAMLFEEVMMQYHFDVTRELAFTDRPDSDNASCNDFTVRWGQRGRVGHDSLKPRATLVLQLLLDQNDVQAHLANLPDPEPLTEGLGWCANLSPAAIGVHAAPGKLWVEPLPEQDRRHSGGHPHHANHQPRTEYQRQ